MNIFFDLDGTLIDSRQRLYLLFQHLVPQSQLSFDEYWSLKRNKVNHQTILKEYFQNQDFSLFEKNWMLLIETEGWLKYDKPFDGITNYLAKLKKENFSLYLITARQFTERVLHQFNEFGWINIFDKILVTEQKYNKEELIRPYTNINETNWIVGDTGKDIQVGKCLGINTAAVLSGFSSKEVLLDYHPDLILRQVIDFNPLPINKNDKISRP